MHHVAPGRGDSGKIVIEVEERAALVGSDEGLVLGRQFMIEFQHPCAAAGGPLAALDVIIDPGRSRVHIRVVRKRIEIHDLLRYRILEGSRYQVAWKRISGGNVIYSVDREGVEDLAAELAEIAAPHFGGRQTQARPLPLALVGSLPVKEEERAIPSVVDFGDPHGTTYRAAIDINRIGWRLLAEAALIK